MNVLVTGVSRGVGQTICETFLQNGHTVYGVSRTLSAELVELKEKYLNKIIIINIDLADHEGAIKNIFKDNIRNSIPLDCYVNNAADGYDDLITNVNFDRLSTMFKINVFTPILLTKYSIRNMIFNRLKGNIIHISSISAHTGYKGLAMYAASKGALEAFSKNTSREWGEKGIRSNVIVPGFMETKMSESLSIDQKTHIYQRTSLKEPTSILSVAKTVAFIASNHAESITGQNIHVDSGTI